jgi:4-oxalocrotonate tautomerase
MPTDTRATPEEARTVPLVRIDMVGGRPPELVRTLIDRLHNAVVDTLQVPPESVTIIVTEVDAEHWASGGTTKAEQRAQRPRTA